MPDLFKSRGGCLKSPRGILRLSGEQVDSVKQRRLWLQRTGVIQNRDRLVKMPIFHLEFCKLYKSGRDRRGSYFTATQLREQLPCPVSAPGAGFKLGKVPPRKCSPRLFRIAHPFLQFAARRSMLGRVKLI